jgi:uncharacterized protein YceH (UPF0502 family)
MPEINAQMALRLHQMTGEPLAHCSYLLGQTNGNYEAALKILERILQERKAETQSPASEDASVTLEDRVARLENQLAQLSVTLETMSGQLTLLLDKLSGSGSGSDPA